MKIDFAKLNRKLGYEFSDVNNITLALTHRSVSGKRNNERLEFLGDSILNFVVTDYLFQQFPQANEGELSRLRAYLVRGKMLAEIAKEYDLGDYLLLGVGELKSGGHRRESILADVVEAIIGAIYLESGLDQASQAIHRWYNTRFQEIDLSTSGKDAKTRLQEYLQSRRLGLPEYEVTDVTGEAHKQTFTVRCAVATADSTLEEICVASTRRKAEQLAAGQILQALGL